MLRVMLRHGRGEVVLRRRDRVVKRKLLIEVWETNTFSVLLTLKQIMQGDCRYE